MSMFVLTFKTTYECNARCSYCHMYKHANKTYITKEIFDKSFERIIEYIESLNLDKDKKSFIRFIWHGGEPLLLDDEFYGYVKERISNVLSFKTNIKAFHDIQTNFTLFHKKDMPNLFTLLNGKFGVSYDPLSNDRKLINQSSYHEEFLKSMIKLKKLGGRASLTYVVTKKNINKVNDFYNFVKNLGFESIEIDPVYGIDDSMSEEEFGDFLIQLWRLWERDSYKINFAILKSWKMMSNTLKKSAGSHYGKSCIKNTFTITPNGDILGCGKQESKPFGNIFKNSFIEIEPIKQKIVDDRLEYLQNTPHECKDCKWWSLCYGECPFSTNLPDVTTKQKTKWCKSYKMLFSEVFEKELEEIF